MLKIHRKVFHLKMIKIESCYILILFHNVTVFRCIFDHVNVALVRIRDFFKKTNTMQTTREKMKWSAKKRKATTGSSTADNTTDYNRSDLVLSHRDAPLASSADTLSACKMLFLFPIVTFNFKRTAVQSTQTWESPHDDSKSNIKENLQLLHRSSYKIEEFQI